jgi:hypothetical protein
MSIEELCGFYPRMRQKKRIIGLAGCATIQKLLADKGFKVSIIKIRDVLK